MLLPPATRQRRRRGVTRGCIDLLSRDELQGVIGHEFSHILNGDMRLNLRLIGIFFGIFCIATIGRILLYARSSNSRDKNPLPLIGLLLVVSVPRRFFWAADPGRRQPAARISGRRLVRAIHAQSRRAFRRAPENRRPRFGHWNRRTPPMPATCFSPTDWRRAFWRDGHAPAAARPHPARLIRIGTANFAAQGGQLKPSRATAVSDHCQHRAGPHYLPRNLWQRFSAAAIARPRMRSSRRSSNPIPSARSRQSHPAAFEIRGGAAQCPAGKSESRRARTAATRWP